MPDASIAVSLKDLYTSGVKSMTDRTKAFSKEADTMISRLRDLGTKQDELVRKQSKLKTSLEDARKELNQAQKAYKANSDEINRTNLERATEQFETLQEQLRSFRDESSRVRREASQLQSDLSKMDNRAGASGGASGGSILGTLGKAGLTSMAGNIAAQWADTLISSTAGSDIGGLFSGALSGAATGAAIGSVIPGLGTVAGAAIGGGLGLLQGASQVYENQDAAYREWYSGLYETASAAIDSSLSTGTTVAGSREQTQMAFAQKLGGDEAAESYLNDVQEMAKSTNYTYDAITGYSKLLLNTYNQEKTLDVLMSLSDATAGLNLNDSDINMFISGLSRMRTTGKATQEYLNYFSERGVDVYQALSDATGADKTKIADMVSGGKISGDTAAQAILDYIDATYGGLSEKLASTYDAMVDNLGDVMTDIDAATGESYNETRKQSIAQQIESYGGELGEALAEANRAIGAGRAALENLADSYTEEALAAVLQGKDTTLEWSTQNTERLAELSDLYQKAMADYEAGNAEAGALVESYVEEARALAEAQYDSSDAARSVAETEENLITAINENTAALQGWRGAYDTSQALTKGRGENFMSDVTSAGGDAGTAYYRAAAAANGGAYVGHGYAVGIDYVPYDNFPALLHQGERVQTAVEARSERSSRPVVITGNNFTVREDADISRIASELLTQMELAESRG